MIVVVYIVWFVTCGLTGSQLSVFISRRQELKERKVGQKGDSLKKILFTAISILILCLAWLIAFRLLADWLLGI